jgi:hypothetical protein
MLKGLGSVLPSPDPSAPSVADSVWSVWTRDTPDVAAFATARAALAALLGSRKIRRLWLPAYCCDTLLHAPQSLGIEVAWYGVDEQLNAVVTDLDVGLATGDAALVIAYFGRAPDEGLRALAAGRPDVLWIEDRAQALDTGVASSGSVTLYSPRKLLGVADGGILVGEHLPSPSGHAADEAELWRPNDLRRADPDGLSPQDWFSAFRARETAFDATPAPCSRRTLASLRSVSRYAEAEARRRNWCVLAVRLKGVALWSDPTLAFAPLAFPIVVDDVTALAGRLAERRIWAARHWADLPSPKAFAAAHALSGRCVSLPLDGRYNAEDMNRIADAVLAGD